MSGSENEFYSGPAPHTSVVPPWEAAAMPPARLSTKRKEVGCGSGFNSAGASGAASKEVRGSGEGWTSSVLRGVYRAPQPLAFRKSRKEIFQSMRPHAAQLGNEEPNFPPVALFAVSPMRLSFALPHAG